MQEEFKTFIQLHQEEQMISLLQSLTTSQRRELSPVVRKLLKYYHEYRDDGSGTHRPRGSSTQLEMLQIASFVCQNMTDYEKSPYSIWFLEGNLLDKVISWCRPEWFSDFVNKQANLDNIPYYINYNRMMELAEKGYLQPSKDLLAKLMPAMVFEHGKDTGWIFKPENLLQRKITIDEHIWYLFEVETNLHYSDRWFNFGKDVSKEKIGWLSLFKQYGEEKRLDRFRLLRESLLASNRNFNKVLSGWFIELFNQLEPTDEEILSLQTEMFGVLSSPHSKPVGSVLQCLKKILNHQKFETGNFLAGVPVLLASTTKNVVASTLMILEKLADINNEQRASIARLVMQVFIHADDDLQAKAAKIIAGNQKDPDEAFKNELSVYFPTMMLSARNTLKEFDTTLGKKEIITPAPEADNMEKNEWLQIAPLESFDDLVFLASQAFDNNQSWHIDWLPAGLIQFQHQLRGENIDKLEPALQRALKEAMSQLKSNQGFLDHMLAIFFIDVCIFLVRKYPNESNSLRLLFKKFDPKGSNENGKWLAGDDKHIYLQGWDNYYHDPCFLIYKQVLLSALEKIRKNDTLPQLSTPTHEPGWILPEVLLQRLVLYQQENIAPDNLDFQMAISRCLVENVQTAVELARTQLIGEYRNLVLFLLEKNAEPQSPFHYPAWWMAASLAKTQKKTYTAFEKFYYYQMPFRVYTGQHAWESIDEEYMLDEYNYELKKAVPVKRRRKMLRVDFADVKPKEEKPKQTFLSKLVGKQKIDVPLLYDLLTIKATYLERHENDARRLLLVAPNNPEPFLVQVLDRCFKYPTFWQETDKKMVITCLQTLHEIWNDLGNIAHVFLGTCMLASDKTVANIAAEIWVKAVAIGKLNNGQLGKAIGLHEKIEFAPLKRLTDLVSQHMLRVSHLHNQQLQVLIEHILAELPDEPVKNLKKLLEIYAELLSMGQSATNEKAMQRVLAWKTAVGLEKLCKIILNSVK